jgi:hypothetical protein
MVNPTTTIKLHLDASSPEEVERFAIDLRRDLSDLEGAELEKQPTATAPAGTKSVLNIDWSTVLVSLVASGGALTALLGVLQSAISKDRRVVVEIAGNKLDLASSSISERQQLIAAWIASQTDQSAK